LSATAKIPVVAAHAAVSELGIFVQNLLNGPYSRDRTREQDVLPT